MKCELEFNWLVNNFCNFDCFYCHTKGLMRTAFRGIADTQKIIDAFNRTNKRCMIYLSGGEPFFMPNFIELCLGLTKEHIISINTNASHKDIFRFAECIDPQRVRCMHLSLHILEKEKHNSVNDFIAKYKLLEKMGFYVYASYVMHPYLIRRFAKDYERFKKEGIILRPKIFRGNSVRWHFFERSYPESYSQWEREIIGSYVEQSQKDGNFLIDHENDEIEGRISDVRLDMRFIEKMPSYAGRDCLAGTKFVRMTSNGDVYRCYDDNLYLGNLFNGGLSLLDGPAKCTAKQCNCPYIGYRYVLEHQDASTDKKTILLMYWDYHTPSKEHIGRLKALASDYEIVAANSKQDAINAAGNAEIIFGQRYLGECLPYTKKLKWLQITAAGVDQLPLNELQRKKILLSRTTVSSKVIARHAHTLAWALIRRLPQTLASQAKERWETGIQFIPEPKTALILGFGAIGKELAKLLKNDGIKIWAVKRSLDEASRKLCDELLDKNSWREKLPEVDLCFLTLPLTAETKGIFDASAIGALPEHAIVVNVSRGEILDEDVLMEQLKKGRLAGAGIDVIETGRARPNCRLWKTPNLIITPHIAAHHPQRAQDIELFFEQQLSDYINNRPLKNLLNLCDS